MCGARTKPCTQCQRLITLKDLLTHESRCKANIDRFLGGKINGNIGSKMNDHKLELLTFSQ